MCLLHCAVQFQVVRALHNPNAITKKVYFDLEVANKPAGRVTIGLYGESTCSRYCIKGMCVH